MGDLKRLLGLRPGGFNEGAHLISSPHVKNDKRKMPVPAQPARACLPPAPDSPPAPDRVRPAGPARPRACRRLRGWEGGGGVQSKSSPARRRAGAPVSSLWKLKGRFWPADVDPDFFSFVRFLFSFIMKFASSHFWRWSAAFGRLLEAENGALKAEAGALAGGF